VVRGGVVVERKRIVISIWAPRDDGFRFQQQAESCRVMLELGWMRHIHLIPALLRQNGLTGLTDVQVAYNSVHPLLADTIGACHRATQSSNARNIIHVY
jgi:hypothetical protein